ncbi:MAG: response regulator [Bacteroidia bacterium]|nr:response regulator [Bacteroidia bacterium]
MKSKPLNILLADDDKDDCLLFKEALKELPVSARLTTVHDGEQLLKRLTKKGNKLPDVIFLDLNMPRKNGFATLAKIKLNKKTEWLPVIIFSTSFEPHMVTQVFNDAAHYYIRKPAEFSQLKNVIQKALTLIAQKDISMPLKENFLLTGDLKTIPD